MDNNYRFNKYRPNAVVSLAFRTFSNKELVNLSVAKIITPLTFDGLGHPLQGGLYDPRLGPVENMAVCATCSTLAVVCPGHIGHIELPLPVVNPIYHKLIGNILKISCLSCYKVLVHPEIKSLFVNQVKLLDAGLVAEALELADLHVSPKSGWSKNEENQAIENAEIYKIETFVDEAMKNSNLIMSENVVEVRGDGNYRADFLKFATSCVSKNKRCPYCNGLWQTLTIVQNKIFVYTPKVEVASKFSKKTTSKMKMSGQSSLNASDCMKHFRNLWANESDFIRTVIPAIKFSTEDSPTDMLFMTNLLVTPPNTRPINKVDGVLVEHPQNSVYKAVLNTCLVIRTLIHAMNNIEDTKLSAQRLNLITTLQGETHSEKLNYAWQDLQSNIDGVLDVEGSRELSMSSLGLKQIIEKKEGIIRKNMMGKRVNFAARSVITPDPNIAIDEIGIPEAFAKKLTFPCPVTEWNVTELRKKVMNGPDIHPGANMIKNDDGSIVKLDSRDKSQREGVAKKLLTLTDNNGIKILYRHLVNGDILLVNRQPTLHKPSIMAHKARILKDEKTLRLHYANCKSYNADFDGDEMNVHFPQNEVARSEAYNLVGVSHQYLVPKDGTPLSGLIQDHVVSAVRMTVRGKFFNKTDYMQLVFQGLSFIHGDIKLLPPAMIKPVQLWSGKQIISTLLINIIPKGKALINLESNSKISSKAWEKGSRPWKAGGTPFTNNLTMSESKVIIRNGELLSGVLDKTQFGSSAYSLVHCMYELYGGEASSKLLSSFSKLFTSFLQREGFTLGVRDILVLDKANKKRRNIIKKARKVGNLAASKALDVPEENVTPDLLREANNKDKQFRNILDREYKLALDQYTNDINRTCLSEGLVNPFPVNNLQLMVQSGAKGSTVNTMQISCLLGQIELEGKRPPVMISGRSLPSFRPFETIPRSGGFIDGRFMTGIKPQEFFFHCMAGREGLIDTAVKTSRSGYLQRCLIKHLEGLTVAYDMTVRDSDNTVIQFLYGEDGLDIAKSQFLKKSQIPFLVDNIAAITQSTNDSSIPDNIKSYNKKLKKWKKKHGDFTYKRDSPFKAYSENVREIDEPTSSKLKLGRTKETLKLIKDWCSLAPEDKESFMQKGKHAPDPLLSKFHADRNFGSISEKLDGLIENYIKTLGDSKRVRQVMYTKYIEGCAAPGEPVGLLAAQSVGEPSTQMTLNTFHFAGRGEMNVTLGIPRLRELLMVASKQIKTPTMTIPFLPGVPNVEVRANKLKKYLNKVTLADVVETITVTEKLEVTSTKRKKIYVLRIKFLPRDMYKDTTHLKPEKIIRYVEKKFINELTQNINRRQKLIQSIVTTETADKNKRKEENNDEEEELPGPQRAKKKVRGAEDDGYISSEDEPQNDDEDATTARRRQRQDGEQQYEDIEDIEDTEVAGEVAGDEVEWAVDDPQPQDKFNEASEESGTENLQVVHSNVAVEKYLYDSVHYNWCEVTLSYPLGTKNVDLSSILKELAAKSVITQVPGIRKVAVMNENGKLVLKTDGLNVPKMVSFSDLVDVNRIYSNDVHAVASIYGIEAAQQTLVNEIINVFKVYGIDVDRRHLTLIADYMTWDGVYRPLNRKGMEGNVSPLQQVSFESSLTTIKSAVIRGRTDQLMTPSARLVTGLPVKSGTGYFQLLQNLDAAWT